MKRIFSALIIILLFFKVDGQVNPAAIPAADISIGNFKDISDITQVFIDSAAAVAGDGILNQKFVPLASIRHWKRIPSRLITKPFYLLFTLTNSKTQKSKVFYYPGSLYDDLELFKADNQLLTVSKANAVDKDGFLEIELEPGSKTTYILKAMFSRNTSNDIESKIISPEFFPFYKTNLEKVLITKKVVGIIFSGALLMMILFTLVNFLLNGKIEFFYFGVYSTCMFFLIFFTSYLSRDEGKFKSFFIGYFDLVLLMGGTIFYLAFVRKFLNTRSIHPHLDKFLRIEQWLIAFFVISYTYLHYGSSNFILENRMEDLMKLIVMGAAIIFVVIAFFVRNRLMNYLALGTAIQLIFYTVSLALIHRKSFNDSVFNSSIFYFELGVVMALIFFLLGLTYKNKTELIGKIKEQEAMKLEVEKRGFETQIAVLNAQQEERNRISADMHDDLGAGMTAIRLYSELARNRTGNIVIPEIDKISSSANELLIKMNAIIWSMSSSNDTLGNMVAYIRTYAVEYLEESNIQAHITVPPNLPEIEVPGTVRRNIFLVVKEALHNVVKHAKATKVDIRLVQDDLAFSLIISDNGKGIDKESIRAFGNGLKNMKKRMQDIGIEFTVENNNGTVITLHRNLKRSLPAKKST